MLIDRTSVEPVLAATKMTYGSSPARAREFETFTIRGTDVAAVDLSRASDLVGQLAMNARGAYVTVTGAHGIVESVHNAQVREAHRWASMVVPDGMPLVWLGRLLGFNSIGRVYGPDLMSSIFSRKEFRQLSHFFYGSTPDVIEKLTTVLTSRFGEFNLAGSYSPPIRGPGFAEDESVLSSIRELKPHFIWVGLSTPKQELWLHMHMPKVGSGVGIGAGAAFDLLSGTVPQAPRWIQRSGFEWLFRLAMEPKRLFKRYVFVVPQFLYFTGETLISQRSNRVANTVRLNPPKQ
jgi:N-acetylglucosaminyldiphosphoundecaprenol N-acetyl-beta-D-mannosaminyltransferase